MPVSRQAELDADLQTIADAKASGFMACLDVRNGLGWDKPGPNGSYYNAAQTAYRWIEDAGEEVVYILPDGGSTTSTASAGPSPRPSVPASTRTCSPACWPSRTPTTRSSDTTNGRTTWRRRSMPVRSTARRPRTWTGTSTSSRSALNRRCRTQGWLPLPKSASNGPRTRERRLRRMMTNECCPPCERTPAR